MRLIETGPVVPDEERGVPVGLQRAELDARRGRLGRELPRVAEQVLQQNLDEAGIGLGDQTLFDHEGHRAVRLGPAERFADASAEAGEVHRRAVQLLSLDLRELEEVVDELTHPLGAGLDAPEVHHSGGSEAVSEVLDEDLAELPAIPRSGARRSWETE